MVLHHSGKDQTKGLRGHSSLLGAVDTQIELLKLEQIERKDGVSGTGIITISKQKDGQDNLKFGFEMVQININQGAESALGLEENVSLAVKDNQEMIDEQYKTPPKPPSRSGAGGVQKVALDALHKAIGDHGEMRVVDNKRNKSIHVEQWRDAFEAAQTDKAGIKKRFNRCLVSLQNAKKIEVFDPFVWIIWSDDSQSGGDF
jgi:hypothetical protein